MALLDDIRAQAHASPVTEICGLLLGRAGEVEAVRPCRNVAGDPRENFEIDPAALIAVHRAARNGGPAPIGHYHSHPNGIAAPSERDAAAAEPGSYWIIVGGQQLTCWFADDRGGFVPVELLTDHRQS